MIALPDLVERLGPVAVGTLALGGILHGAGAVIYARLVVAAAALQYAVVAFWVL